MWWTPDARSQEIGQGRQTDHIVDRGRDPGTGRFACCGHSGGGVLGAPGEGVPATSGNFRFPQVAPMPSISRGAAQGQQRALALLAIGQVGGRSRLPHGASRKGGWNGLCRPPLSPRF